MDTNNVFSFSDVAKIIVAIILPPVGVFLERGCGADFLINILLTILGMYYLCTAPVSLTARHHVTTAFTCRRIG